MNDETIGRRSPDFAVVIDSVSVVYTVTSTGADDEVRVSWPVRTIRKALGRPALVQNEAVKDVRLAISEGEFVAFIGRNGSGKSSLMNTVAGQLTPTRGTVWTVDVPVKMGVNVSLVPELSGELNIRLGCLAQGLSPREVDRLMPELTDVAALGDAVHWPMKAYSSGMAARLRFAVATAATPHVLILDEALGTGDAQFQARGKARMDEIRAQAGCVLFVSHSMNEVRESATRVVWLDAGSVVMDGAPEEVTATYEGYMAQLAAGNLLSARRQVDSLRERLRPHVLVDTSISRRRRPGHQTNRQRFRGHRRNDGRPVPQEKR